MQNPFEVSIILQSLKACQPPFLDSHVVTLLQREWELCRAWEVWLGTGG